MVPFYLFLATTLLLRVLGLAGIEGFFTLKEAVRCGLALMFVFAGSLHFTAMREDFERMVPAWVPVRGLAVPLTGLLEIAGGIGLMVPVASRIAAAALGVMLLFLTPANIHAALDEVPFRGRTPTPLWLRLPAQAVLVASAVWLAVAG